MTVRKTADATYVPLTWRDRATKTRVYPYHWPDRDEVAAAYPKAQLPPADTEHAPDGIFRSLDAAWRKLRTLQTKLARRQVLAKLAELGYTDVPVTFSRKAGCSCGCSPGFIASRLLVDPVTNHTLNQLSLHTPANTEGGQS